MAFPSTTIKLDIAFINVSMLLIVSEIPNIIIIIDKTGTWSVSNRLKNARSGITSSYCDTAIKPQNPIIKTIGINVDLLSESDKIYFDNILGDNLVHIIENKKKDPDADRTVNISQSS